jgi:hypothetical protein
MQTPVGSSGSLGPDHCRTKVDVAAGRSESQLEAASADEHDKDSFIHRGHVHARHGDLSDIAQGQGTLQPHGILFRTAFVGSDQRGSVRLSQAALKPVGTSERSDHARSSQAPSLRHPWLLPGILVLVAFAFRILLGGVFMYYGGDAPQYTALAKNLAAGHGYSIATAAPYLASDLRVPAYPALLAIAFWFDGSHWSVIVLNALLGSVSTLFVWLICRDLRLSRPRALWATGICALFLSTASMAGVALSENLSAPAVLALVYFVLIRPPKSRLWLFVGGSLLAWLVALTRDELLLFVVLVAFLAARRAHLKVFATLGLAACFLLGPGAWVIRNEVQVHRTEYVDSVMTEQVIAASVNGNLASPAYNKAVSLIEQPTISPSERSSYRHLVTTYVKEALEHHPAAFVEDKGKYYVESLFPVPIFGLTYVSTTNVLGWFVWSLAFVLLYACALITTVRWWRSKRRRDVVTLLLFPAYMLCFQVVFDPQYRFWLPAVLLLLPLATEAVSADTYRSLTGSRAKNPSSPKIAA